MPDARAERITIRLQRTGNERAQGSGIGTVTRSGIRRDSYVRPRLLGPTRSLALVAAALALFAAGVASAPALAYSAQPPTKGALYRDGQTGRYLLGGAWLYRPDPADVGVAQGWWRDVAASVGWSAARSSFARPR